MHVSGLRSGARSVCAAMLVLVAGTGGAAPALAHGSGHGGGGGGPVVSDPIVSGLAGPLQFQVAFNRILVGQSFAGIVSQVKNGVVTDLFEDAGVDGVAYGPRGSIVYTHSDFDNNVKELRMRTADGETKVLADLGAFEAANNPDGGQTYGFVGLSAECAALFPPDAGIAPYTGIVDSHPYAVTATPFGYIVADAGGNDILFVDRHGGIRVVAVLPAQPGVTVTAEFAAANELPDCVVGASFVAEPVPTDVEIGHDGNLYVTTLPGGPEDPSLGARGSVYRVNLWNGRVKLVATGFAGATNLAIGPRGTIYVSELFGNRVSAVVKGAPQMVAELPAPSGLEFANGRLYVGTDSFGAGNIQTIKP
jgi:hypothetical protein